MTASNNSNVKGSVILIVDDNPQNLQLLGKILQENDYKVEFATSGLAALDWISIKSFDLILLDVNMPVMDGFEVCSKIRSNPAMDHIPVVFLSAETERESILKGFELGAQDYVTKPFDSRELLVRIRTHLSLKDTLEKLEIEKENAQSADHLKSAFLATMSHELRTPLNSIIGFTGILIQGKPGPLNEEQRKQLGMVQNSSRHLLSLINDVLDISKIEAGQLKINLDRFDLPELINKVIETNKPSADKKNLVVTVTIADNVKDITSDSLRVQQILINLLNNAIKFTDRGSISVTCSIIGEFVRIKVTDTGIGIEGSKIEKLFKPFIQLETGLTRRHEGTGLGLSICKKLTEMLDGKIEVESVFGEGSTFSFTLPLIKT